MNIIRKTIKLVVDPPPPLIIAKDNTGAASKYITPADTHETVNIQPTNIGPRVRLLDNSTMEPQLVRHLTLALQPAATKTHVFSLTKCLITIGWSVV